MQRGFKTWAERQAVIQRQALGLRPEAPLPARVLAEYLEIVIAGPADIAGMTEALLDQLLMVDSASWSAVTVAADGCTLIIHNPIHSSQRQESDLMHEMAHVLCRHRPGKVIQFAGGRLALREYDEEQEEEARWFGAVLQLPRPVLLWAVHRGMDDTVIVEHFGASAELVRYRRQVTAVDRQLLWARTKAGVR